MISCDSKPERQDKHLKMNEEAKEKARAEKWNLRKRERRKRGGDWEGRREIGLRDRRHRRD